MKQIALLILFTSMFAGISCSKRQPLPPPLPPPTTSVPDKADVLFESGDFQGAAQEYEKSLNGPEITFDEANRIRLRLGMIYANPKFESCDLEKALEYLKTASSGSGLKSEAAILISLLEKFNAIEGELRNRKKELNQISEELNKLKSVDRERRRSKNP